MTGPNVRRGRSRVGRRRTVQVETGEEVDVDLGEGEHGIEFVGVWEEGSDLRRRRRVSATAVREGGGGGRTL